MSFEGFRQAYRLNDGANASFIDNQTSGLSAGTYTQPFSITPFKKSRCLAAVFKLVGTATATAPEIPVAGSDALDIWLGGGGDVEVSDETGGAIRSQAITRQFAEFVWTVATDLPIGVAAAPTFASAGSATVTAYLLVPLGVEAASVKLKIAGNVTGVWAAGVTFSYTSVKCYVVSTDFTGTVAFMEENTASLATNAVSLLNWVPKSVAPDAIFLKGETSTTITQVSVITVSNNVLVQTQDTDINQAAWSAGGIAPVAGTTYTTGAGFVIQGNGEAFKTFQVWFSSATTHYLGYIQIEGGGPYAENPKAAPTQAEPAVARQGTVTPSGTVRAASSSPAGSSGSGLGKGPGSAGSIISRRH